MLNHSDAIASCGLHLVKLKTNLRPLKQNARGEIKFPHDLGANMYQNSVKDYNKSFTPEVLPKETYSIDKLDQRIGQLERLMPTLQSYLLVIRCYQQILELRRLKTEHTAKKEELVTYEII